MEEEGKAVENVAAEAADVAVKAEEPVKRPHEDESGDGDGNADNHKEGGETRSPEKKKHKTDDGTAEVSDTVATGGTEIKVEADGGEYRPQCKKFCCNIQNLPLVKSHAFA